MTNNAAQGYMVLAAKRLGLDKDTIQKLDMLMYQIMDEKTEEEAEEACKKY